MRESVRVVGELVAGVRPFDAVEAAHRRDTLDWLAGTDDVYRRVRPATPPRHLVSYVVPVDPADGGCLLGLHRNAGLWLPPGGHVEPGEHPAQAARREAAEELGAAAATVLDVAQRPEFLTVTETVGVDRGHVDVSLWFVLPCRREQALDVDPGEFADARWWTPAEVAAAPADTIEPHLPRFLAKRASLR